MDQTIFGPRPTIHIHLGEARRSFLAYAVASRKRAHLGVFEHVVLETGDQADQAGLQCVGLVGRQQVTGGGPEHLQRLVPVLAGHTGHQFALRVDQGRAVCRRLPWCLYNVDIVKVKNY